MFDTSGNDSRCCKLSPKKEMIFLDIDVTERSTIYAGGRIMYSIKELSEISGVSTRTLRYYDEIDLLSPSCVNESRYRYYGEYEVMLLQQILFYKERGLDLNSIKKIIYQKDFDVLGALEEHLLVLKKKYNQMAQMIDVLTKTIALMKGEKEMGKEEMFVAFKKQMIHENEQKYGKEIREKYGDTSIDESNRKMLNMTQEQWDEFQILEKTIKEQLKNSVINSDPVDSELAKGIVINHKKWLMMTWNTYKVEAHKGLASMYVLDERFRLYYDHECDGCAEYLKKAILYWAEKL